MTLCLESVFRKIFILLTYMLTSGWCSFDIASSCFFRPSKVWSTLHHGSVGASSEYYKRNLTQRLTLTLNLLLPSIVFHNKICGFIMIFTALSFLPLIHDLFLFIHSPYEEVMSVRVYVCVQLYSL